MKKNFILLCILPLMVFSARAQQFQLENNALILPSPVVFETGTDKLKPESFPALQHVADYLAAKSYITLMRVEGHSDNDGKESVIQLLTEKRAVAICRWLIAHGVDCKRLIAVGFGSNKPLESNSTPEGRAANRRFTFVNATLRGRAIGGFPVDGGGKVADDPCK